MQEFSLRSEKLLGGLAVPKPAHAGTRVCVTTVAVVAVIVVDVVVVGVVVAIVVDVVVGVVVDRRRPWWWCCGVVVFDNHPFFQVDAGKARRRLSSLRAVTKGGFHLADVEWGPLP